MHTWIIGAGGLLGSALMRHADSIFRGTPIPWHDPREAGAVLQHDLQDFRSSVETDWSIIWAAGAATTASGAQAIAVELGIFQVFAELLSDQRPAGSGSVLLASSAGGVYAGSTNPPFTSASKPRPVGAYGQLKVDQEDAAREILGGNIPLVLARFANLYGMGQRLNKTQGLITTLVRSAFTREPVNIFVSIDTLRDYIYSDDAAKIALHWARQACTHRAPETDVRVIASGQAHSIGSVIATVSDVTRLRIPIALGSHSSGAFQSADLRLAPDEDAVTRQIPITPLPVGVKRVTQDLLNRLQVGSSLAR